MCNLLLIIRDLISNLVAQDKCHHLPKKVILVKLTFSKCLCTCNDRTDSVCSSASYWQWLVPSEWEWSPTHGTAKEQSLFSLYPIFSRQGYFSPMDNLKIITILSIDNCYSHWTTISREECCRDKQQGFTYMSGDKASIIHLCSKRYEGTTGYRYITEKMMGLNEFYPWQYMRTGNVEVAHLILIWIKSDKESSPTIVAVAM